jgi:hypothetical protein
MMHGTINVKLSLRFGNLDPQLLNLAIISKDTDNAIVLVAGTLDNSFRTKFQYIPEICNYVYP